VNKILTPELSEELRLLKQDLGLAIKRADEASRNDEPARASKARELVASMKRRIAEIEGA
jgi:hypothetical protein